MRFHDETRAPLTKFGLYGIVTLMVALIAVGSWIAAKDAGRTAADAAVAAVLRQSALGCDRNQIQRAYLRIRARDRAKDSANRIELADAYFRTVNCEKTYAKGATTPVFLSASDDRCFVKLTLSGLWAHRTASTDPVILHSLC